MIYKRFRQKKAPRVWYDYCTDCGKVAFPNPQAANSVRLDFVRAKKSDRFVRIYPCPKGTSWHIGSSKPRG